jgi:hypothetical protein
VSRLRLVSSPSSPLSLSLGLLTTSVGLVEQVADQLYYLRIGTIFRFATSFLVDADDARRDPTPRPMGGLAHPTSTAGARSIPRRAVDNDPLE